MEIILITLIIIIGTSTLAFDLYWPVKDWDSLALYDSRARIFTTTGFIGNYAPGGYFLSYPLYTTMLHIVVYLTGYNNPMFIYSLLYISFLAVFYSLIRTIISRKKSLIFTLILAAVPDIYQHSEIAYTNLAYTIFFCLGAFYLYFWIMNRKVSFLLISGLLTGLSTWARRTEPFWIWSTLVVLLFMALRTVQINYKNRDIKLSKKNLYSGIYSIILYGIIFSIIFLPWGSYVTNEARKMGVNVLSPLSVVSNSVIAGITPSLVARVFDYLYRFVVLPIWPLFLGSLISAIYLLIVRKKIVFSLILYGYIFLVVVGTLLFGASYAGWQEIHGSLHRMSIFLSPLLLFHIALIFSDITNPLKDNAKIR